MYQTISSDQSKIELVKRLLEAKQITYEESLRLLEVQVVKEYVYWPYYYQHQPNWLTPIVTGTVDTLSVPFTFTNQ